MTPDPNKCTLSVAERWLGTSRQTLTKYIRDQGAPYVSAPEGKGESWIVSVPKLHAWLIEKREKEAEQRVLDKLAPDPESPDGEMSKEEAQRRRAVADALMSEIKLDREAGRVVLIDLVKTALVSVLAPVRKRMLEYPQKIGREMNNRFGVDPNAAADVARGLVDKDLEALQAERVKIARDPDAERWNA